jgi:succinate dehydrogenase flavin-adding protein (antitoxin of CptAB toxin-antitoxin module)
MFNLDDNFLEEVGLGALPDEQKKPFLQHIYDQLEQRVGVKLSEGMSDAQLEEFEAIIDRKDDVVKPWLESYAPQYQSDELFGKLQQATKLPADSPALRAEYAATKWLEVNRPDYRDVVAATLESLKQEIIANKDAILSGA